MGAQPTAGYYELLLSKRILTLYWLNEIAKKQCDTSRCQPF